MGSTRSPSILWGLVHPRNDDSYIIFGKPAYFAPLIDVTQFTSADGIRIPGSMEISGAGDFNGDGIDDLVIGDSSANTPAGESSGAAYIVFGRKEGFGEGLNLDTLTEAQGFSITGLAAGDSLGVTPRGIGDINGDGLDDVMIGAFGAEGGNGAAYVIFGKRGGVGPALDLATLDQGSRFQNRINQQRERLFLQRCCGRF